MREVDYMRTANHRQDEPKTVSEEPRIIGILKEAGALLLNDHFVLTSGEHSDGYIRKERVSLDPELVDQVGEEFAKTFKDLDVDYVAAPAVAGIPFALMTALHLGRMQGRPVLDIYTEKDGDGKQILNKRGFDKLVVGKNVLVVEDVTTTGGSVKKVIDEVRSAGGIVVAAGVMINRNPDRVTSETIGAPFKALGVVRLNSYKEDACSLCEEGRPINTTVGHGKDFLRKLQK